MPRSFNWPGTSGMATSRTRIVLVATTLGLLALNAVVAYFYVDPPGGTQRELRAESESLKVQLRSAAASTTRFENVAAKVQSGSTEAVDFAKRYFLPKRVAYDAVLTELQRMAKESGLVTREKVFTEEPIEGSADLTLLNVTANFEGSYDNLMKFLYQVDKSPSLLILDTLQASPQQHGGQVNTSIRFQTIIRDEAGEGVQQ